MQQRLPELKSSVTFRGLHLNHWVTQVSQEYLLSSLCSYVTAQFHLFVLHLTHYLQISGISFLYDFVVKKYAIRIFSYKSKQLKLIVFRLREPAAYSFSRQHGCSSVRWNTKTTGAIIILISVSLCSSRPVTYFSILSLVLNCTITPQPGDLKIHRGSCNKTGYL